MWLHWLRPVLTQPSRTFSFISTSSFRMDLEKAAAFQAAILSLTDYFYTEKTEIHFSTRGPIPPGAVDWNYTRHHFLSIAQQINSNNIRTLCETPSLADLLQCLLKLEFTPDFDVPISLLHAVRCTLHELFPVNRKPGFITWRVIPNTYLICLPIYLCVR